MVARERTEIIVVHHSASPSGNVESIRQWHKKRRFDDIGYHYVILHDGTVEKGRPENLVGAHAMDNERNWKSIGICLIGEDNFTEEQIISLKKLLTELCQKYNIKEIQRHHEKCPGIGLDLERIAKYIF